MATISLSDAKAHLVGVDFTDDDAYISGLCDLVDELILTEIKGSISGRGTLAITSGVSGITGTDTNFLDYTTGYGIEITDSDGLKIDAIDRTISTITDNNNLTVSAAFSKGASELNYIINIGIPNPVPLGLKQAMKLIIAHFYTNREPVLIGTNCVEIPFAYKYLVTPYKQFTIS